MEDREFLAAFEAGTLPEELFRHRDHVRAAWLLLRGDPPAAALARFSAALKRFAAVHGKSRLYHETITWAYLLLIGERIGRSATGQEWEAFARENADLLTWRPSILETYYRQETLQSDLARSVFVFPDRLARD
ncbi:MAG TPA: hypothetical protein VLO07_08285 [Thermoanaerobaculia bacterium]|nr:hypothetical protein [Thermoanaerobaculia bacterium]